MKSSVQPQKNETATINTNMSKVALSKQQLKQVKGGSDGVIIEELIVG